MKRIFSQNNGLTLTELLIASIVVGIVMVGVAAYSTSIKNVQDTTIKAARVNLQLSSALKMMKNDLSLATGNITDYGIQYDANAPGGTVICARQDDDSTPADFTDDMWICWFKGNGAGNPLRRCVDVPQGNVTASTAVPTTTFTNGDCNQANRGIRDFFPLAASSLPGGLHFDADPLGTGLLEYIEAELVLRADIGSAAHPLRNPEHTVSTKVNLPLHSRN